MDGAPKGKAHRTTTSMRSHPLKAYLITTGSLFGLLALLHLALTIQDRSRLLTDPAFLVRGPGIGILALGLCLWAVALLRRSGR